MELSGSLFWWIGQDPRFINPHFLNILTYTQGVSLNLHQDRTAHATWLARQGCILGIFLHVLPLHPPERGEMCDVSLPLLTYGMINQPLWASNIPSSLSTRLNNMEYSSKKRCQNWLYMLLYKDCDCVIVWLCFQSDWNQGITAHAHDVTLFMRWSWNK